MLKSRHCHMNHMAKPRGPHTVPISAINSAVSSICSDSYEEGDNRFLSSRPTCSNFQTQFLFSVAVRLYISDYSFTASS